MIARWQSCECKTEGRGFPLFIRLCVLLSTGEVLFRVIYDIAITRVIRARSGDREKGLEDREMGVLVEGGMF